MYFINIYTHINGYKVRKKSTSAPSNWIIRMILTKEGLGSG